jgi:hypothetical protein
LAHLAPAASREELGPGLVVLGAANDVEKRNAAARPNAFRPAG